MVPVWMTLSDSDFKVTILFNVKYGLSNDAIFYDLEQPLTHFQGHAILQRWISDKRLKIRP